jgi:hypothetical protein
MCAVDSCNPHISSSPAVCCEECVKSSLSLKKCTKKPNWYRNKIISVTQRRFVCTDVSGKPKHPIFSGQAVGTIFKKPNSPSAWTLNVGATDWPETSVTINERCVTFQKNRHCGGSLNWRNLQHFWLWWIFVSSKHIGYYTGRFILYSGITKIYYRETVGHVYLRNVYR